MRHRYRMVESLIGSTYLTVQSEALGNEYSFYLVIMWLQFMIHTGR